MKMFDTIRTRFSDTWKSTKTRVMGLSFIDNMVDRAHAIYDRMDARQRLIALGSGIGASLLIFALIAFVAIGHLQSLEKRSTEGHKLLTLVQETSQEFRENERKLSQMGRERMDDGTFSLQGFLERWALESGIPKEAVDSMNSKDLPPKDTYQETEVQVKLKKINLRHLTNYLYKIENSRFPLRVKFLGTKTRFDDTNTLDVTFTVSSYAPKG
jgi:hypothetical protein